jgi:LysM repeat protein
MAAPSPVRFLAPIALVVTLLAVIVVLASSDGGGSGGDDGATRRATTTQAAPVRRTYVVRRGDTLVSIAERFGLTQERLLALNPDVDAQALQPGKRLKLRP